MQPSLSPTRLPYTTLFRSEAEAVPGQRLGEAVGAEGAQRRIARTLVRLEHAPGQEDRVAAGRPERVQHRLEITRSEEHTSELHHPSISYAAFRLKNKTRNR